MTLMINSNGSMLIKILVTKSEFYINYPSKTP